MCTFLLWSHTVYESPPSGHPPEYSHIWLPEGSAETFEACRLQAQTAVKHYIATFERTHSAVAPGKDATTLMGIDPVLKHVYVKSFECWPETMDPRK